MKYLVRAIAVAMAMTSLPAFAAVLVGSTVTGEYRLPTADTPYGPTTYDPQTFTVGDGVESRITIEDVTTFNIDFSDLALDVDFDTVLNNPRLNDNPFNGLVFTSDAFAQISGFTLDAATNLAGFGEDRVTFVGNELRLNFSGLTYNDDTFVGLNFVATAVPEPSTWAMMLVGFGAVGGVVRRRRTSLGALRVA